jgi:hypothetical protein
MELLRLSLCIFLKNFIFLRKRYSTYKEIIFLIDFKLQIQKCLKPQYNFPLKSHCYLYE